MGYLVIIPIMLPRVQRILLVFAPIIIALRIIVPPI
jgi:hypothetical protein